MKKEVLISSGKKLQVLLPDELSSPLPLFCFINVDEQMLSSLYNRWEKRYQKRKFIAANIPVESWNDDLSPWKMEAVFLHGQPFGGKADRFLALLTEEFLPQLEGKYPVQKENRAVIGYSLGGLFALYSAYRTDAFKKVGCLSGSLWFRGFLQYTSENQLQRNDMKLYFSLGDKESKTKNPAIASIGENTLAIAKHLKALLGEEAVRYEITAGGHTTQVENRFDKAISWLVKE